MNFIFPFSWECHHPNWRTHIFQRGRSTTNQYVYIYISGTISIPWVFILQVPHGFVLAGAPPWGWSFSGHSSGTWIHPSQIRTSLSSLKNWPYLGEDEDGDDPFVRKKHVDNEKTNETSKNRALIIINYYHGENNMNLMCVFACHLWLSWFTTNITRICDAYICSSRGPLRINLWLIDGPDFASYLVKMTGWCICFIIFHRNGCWEKLQKSAIFDGKNHGFL